MKYTSQYVSALTSPLARFAGVLREISSPKRSPFPKMRAGLHERSITNHNAFVLSSIKNVFDLINRQFLIFDCFTISPTNDRPVSQNDVKRVTTHVYNDLSYG